MTDLRIETHRSGVFVFRTGLDQNLIDPLLDKANYAHRLFSSIPLLPHIASQLEKETLLASIHGTDTIEGGTLSEDEILQIIESTQEVTQEQPSFRISNLKKAYQFAEQTVQDSIHLQQPFKVSEQFIITLHQLISQDIHNERYRPGQYRDNPKGQITRVGNDNHGGIYKPPQAHIDIKLLMKHLVEWLNSPKLMQFSPLLRAILAHYYFERIHPFNDGNGRVGRLLEKTLLIASGYQYAGRGVDRYYLENIDRYFLVFNQSRKLEKEQPNTCNHAFVEFVLEGFCLTIERLHQRANQLIKHFLMRAWLGDLLRNKKINHREHFILEYLGSQSKVITLPQLKQLSWYKELYRSYSPATESRDWSHLFKTGFIKKLDKDGIKLNPFQE